MTKPTIFKFWVLFVLVPIAVFFLFIYTFLVIGVKNRIDTQNNGQSYVSFNKQATGDIIPRNDYLNIIILRMRNIGIANADDFKFDIYDPNNEMIREITFNGKNVGDPSDVRLQFTPIENSKGGNYKFILTSEGLGQSILVGIDNSRKLSYTAYYRTANKSNSVRSIVFDFVSRAFKDIGFFVIWLLLLSVIIVVDVRYPKTN
jgi:hypothetical protein